MSPEKYGEVVERTLDRGCLRSLYLRDPDGHIVEIATGDSRPAAATEPTG